MPLSVELLASHHDRAAFSCGVEALDRYLHQQVGQDVRRDVALCYVACEHGTPTIAGYFTLSALGLARASLPEHMTRRLPRYETLPAILIGRLAVDRRFAGQGLGGALLFEALDRASRTGVGVLAVVVDAIDERAARFYEHHGFKRFLDVPNRLFISLADVRTLLGDRRFNARP